MKPRGNVVVLIRAKEYLAKTKQNKTKQNQKLRVVASAQ